MAEVCVETKRLVLRQWRASDHAPFAEMNADPEVMRYFHAPLSQAESDALIERITRHFDAFGFGLFALERKADKAFMGFTGLLHAPRDTPVAGEVEIGWRIARQYWRQGFAFEAAKACIDWFWHGTDRARLVSFTSEQNEPSQKLMRKLGLSHRPDLDFNHPAVPTDDPLCRQSVFIVEREGDSHG